MPFIGSQPPQAALTSGSISSGAVNSDQVATGAIDLAHMSSQSVDADNLHISNAGSNGQFLSKQSGDAGGLTWAAAAQFANWSQSSGHLTPDNATYGIHLGVTTATAANLLDDYEEGVYTGTIAGMTSGSFGVASGNDQISYTKVGRMVFICGQLNIDSESSCSGAIRINLPFTTENSAEGANSGKTWIQMNNHGDGGIENPAIVMQHNVAYAQIQNMRDDGISEPVDSSRLDTNFTFSFSFSYLAA